MIYTKKNILTGAIIYSIGDAIATLLLNDFSTIRFLFMALIGATIYAFEIPNVFIWIDKKTQHLQDVKKTLTKTTLAVLYFNPIWIARHLFLIKLFSKNRLDINLRLLEIAWWSFLVNIPISFVANYIIQNKIKLENRFLASAVFSGIMAVYYAFSETLFG